MCATKVGILDQLSAGGVSQSPNFFVAKLAKTKLLTVIFYDVVQIKNFYKIILEDSLNTWRASMWMGGRRGQRRREEQAVPRMSACQRIREYLEHNNEMCFCLADLLSII